MYVAVGSLLCAFLVALVGVAGARADDGSVPADVQRWFETSAATIVADDSEALAEGGGEGELARVSVCGLGRYVAGFCRRFVSSLMIGRIVPWVDPQLTQPRSHA